MTADSETPIRRATTPIRRTTTPIRGATTPIRRATTQIKYLYMDWTVDRRLFLCVVDNFLSLAQVLKN